ncbi:MAG: DUF4080 domain-containing protein [Victivallales bacterium]|nr:DUF4080 domain-containing protein [Victivallales bacterium]
MSRKLKILYLSVNCSYSHSSLVYAQVYSYTNYKFPGCLWEKQEYTTKDNLNVIVNNIIKTNPDILLSSIYLFNRIFIFDIINKVKLLYPYLKIILGGPEFLGDNRKTLKATPEIDAVIRGDESSFYLYLRSLMRQKNDTCKIPGLCCIDKNGEYFDNGFSSINGKSLDVFPSPYQESLIPKGKPFMQLETSRGCFYSCSFCTSSLSEEVKFYSLERIKFDLLKLRELGYKEIRVLDRTFNVPAERSCKLLDIFINEFPDMNFHLEFEPSQITDKILDTLKKAPANQFHIEAGVQSFCSDSLKSVKRYTSPDITESKLSSLISLKKIEVHADLIYGLPYQTAASVFNDLNKLIINGPNEIQVESLKVLPGTLTKNTHHKKFIYSSKPPYETLATPDMSLENILRLQKISKLIDTFYNNSDIQKLIVFAVNRNKSFITEFLNFTEKTLSATGKPSLKHRIKLLDEYAKEKDDKVLADLILFTSCKMGIVDITKSNLKLVKKHEISGMLKKGSSLIYNSDAVTLEKPAYLGIFDFNVGHIWKNPSEKIIQANYRYLFRFSYGGLSKKVSKIDHV